MTVFMLRFRLATLILMVSQLLSGCSSIEYPPDKAPRMVVLHDGVPFYLHGPAQGNGSDGTLAQGDEVQVLRKEFGYSFVQRDTGQKGFVANEELATAPPLPKQSPTPSQNLSTPSLWPQEKSLPDIPTPDLDTNEPLAPPGFRY